MHVIERQFAGLDEMSHHRCCAAAKEIEQFVDQFAVCVSSGYCRFEDVRIADLANTADNLLDFEAINNGLNRRISRLSFSGKTFLNVPNRRRALGPECLHNLQFE